ncbi:MAG: glycosyltransferase family 39 protein, partial [Bacteroidia bacterium]|nr:glycosyltransferase family 39 protein [Bacteroidia bacterium]
MHQTTHSKKLPHLPAMPSMHAANRRKHIVSLEFIIFALISGFSFYYTAFINFSKEPIYLWDEVRVATNAVEMYSSGNPILTTYTYRPETWNLKPPLLLWLQSLSIAVFGIHEGAVRLPSIGAVLICLAAISWCLRKLFPSSWLPALVGNLVLLGSQGFMGYHVARTADYDALLSCWVLLALISFWLWLQNPDRHNSLLICAGAIAAASLTKGVAGFFVLPFLVGSGIYYLRLRGSARFCTRFLLIISASLLPLVVYYLVREMYQPGHFRLIWENELGGRYNATLDGHQH